MKKLLLSLLLVSAFVSAQSTQPLKAPNGLIVGGGTITANSILDVQSTTKGILIPRMTTTQKGLIADPANSMLVFDTTLDKYFRWSDSESSWIEFGGGGNYIPLTGTEAGSPVTGPVKVEFDGSTTIIDSGSVEINNNSGTVTQLNSGGLIVQGAGVGGVNISPNQIVINSDTSPGNNTHLNASTLTANRFNGMPDADGIFGVSVNGVPFDAFGNVNITGGISSIVAGTNISFDYSDPLNPIANVPGFPTNLSYTASPTGGSVNSDTGTDATLTLAGSTNAGLMAPAQHDKLATIATGATNVTVDTTLADGSANAISNNAVFDGLDGKVDKVSGKQLSTEDFTTPLLNKLNGLTTTIPSAAGQAVNPIVRPSLNISDNLTFIQNGRYDPTTGAYTADVAYLSLGKQDMLPSTVYTLSGIGTITPTYARVVFYSGVGGTTFISSIAGANNNNALTFTSPAGTTKFTVTIGSGYGGAWGTGVGIGSSPSTSVFLKTVMVQKGTIATPWEPFGWTIPSELQIFVSTTGDNTTGNGTINFPYRNVSKATDIASLIFYKGGTIYMRGGDYVGEVLPSSSAQTLKGKIKLKAYNNEVVRIIHGQVINAATLEPGYTKVYKSNTSVPVNVFNRQLWQHDIADTNSAIVLANRQPEHGFLTHRLSSTRIPKAANLAAIEAASTPMWFNIGTDVYFSKVAASDIAVNPIIVPAPGYVYATNYEAIEGITLLYSGLMAISEVTIKNTSSLYTNVYSFAAGPGANVILENCRGGGAYEDAFNYSGLSGKTKEINCWAHDNGDEGSSAHDIFTIEREGGLYEYNVSAGIVDVGSSISMNRNLRSLNNTTGGYEFSHSSVSGTNLGTAVLHNCITDGGVQASVAGRVKWYNGKAGGTISVNVTQL